MTERRNFNRDYVENELRKLAPTLKERVAVFVAGGAAMAFYGLKEATKDIDVIVQSKAEFDSLVTALHNLGYRDPYQGLTVIYAQTKASAILENLDGFRWDIFEQTVANRLFLSKGMIRRSRKLVNKGNLQASLLSKEDIFLLKSVTDRDRDIDDMGVIAESGVNWNVIAKECHLQASNSTTIWEDKLCNRLKELKEKRSITFPIERTICRIADQKILETWIEKKVREGVSTVGDYTTQFQNTKSLDLSLEPLAHQILFTVHVQ